MQVWAKAIAVLSIILTVLFSGCITPDGIMPNNIMPGCIQGSGNYITENRSLDDFQEIELSIEGNVYLSQGQRSLRIEAEDNIIQKIETTVSAGRLRIGHRASCINPRMSINIYVSTPEIHSLLVSGSGRVIGQTPIESDALRVVISGSGNTDLELVSELLRTTISGSGNALLRGAAENSEVIISGSGSVHGYDLVTDSTKVTVSGSGTAEVNAVDELNALVSGSGIVYYRGSPAQISQEVRGSGRVIAEG